MYLVRRLACTLALVAASALLSACSADDAAPPAPTTAPSKAKMGPGSNAQETPEKLFAEYVTKAATMDSEQTCAMFTQDGALSFTDEWTADTCAAAVGKASSAIKNGSDPAKRTTPGTNTKDSDTVVELSGCGIGGIKALKSDKGWLIDDYRHPDAVDYCKK